MSDKLAILGKLEQGCVIAGFVAIGPAGGLPSAYVAMEADAALFIAAPDLLNACREALKIRSLAYQVDANPKLDILTRREIERMVDGIIERIEAAIAKAEGSDR